MAQTADEKKQEAIDKLTKQQREAYLAERSRYFKGTIVVCVIYGVLALGMLLLAVFSPKGREILADTLLPFTVTFIGGMLFIIILLTISVLNFGPPIFVGGDPMAMVCPDYWHLEETPASVVRTFAAEDQYLVKYRCKRTDTSSAPPSSVPLVVSPAQPANTKLYNTYSPKMYGDSEVKCDTVYPYFMSVKDNQEKIGDKTNAMRCEYARVCKTPWSSVCPDIPTNAS